MKYATYFSYELIIFPRNHLLDRPCKSMFNTMKTHKREKPNSVRLFCQWLQWKTRQATTGKNSGKNDDPGISLVRVEVCVNFMVAITYCIWHVWWRKDITIAYIVNHWISLIYIHYYYFLELVGNLFQWINHLPHIDDDRRIGTI